jgi:hypothetical protein
MLKLKAGDCDKVQHEEAFEIMELVCVLGLAVVSRLCVC